MTIRPLCALVASAALACLVQAPCAFAGPGSSFAQASSRGSIAASKSCTDRLGSGEVVLVEEREHSHTCGGEPCADKYIHAYRFADDEQIWQINDLVEECDFDLTLEFFPQALRITDLDGDGLSEIWVVYHLGCFNDISPRDMKLIMYEGRKKHAMRGVQLVNLGERYEGGEYKMDAAFREGPESFRRYAKNLWAEFVKAN